MVSVMDSPALPGELFDQDGSGTGPPTHAVAEEEMDRKPLTNLTNARTWRRPHPGMRAG